MRRSAGALGVWAALLGSILLLMRSRYAVWAFALSLVGMVLSFGGQYCGPPLPAEMTAGAMKYVPMVIVLLALIQAWYAWRERRRACFGRLIQAARGTIRSISAPASLRRTSSRS